MLYLIYIGVDAHGNQVNELAVCENAARIERFEAQGFVHCSYEALREVWRKQNAQAFKRLQAAARTAALHTTDCG